ncbi:MAG TPA: hypothetical protein VHC96_24700 [Puia sp.]|jgi:hypothetical protein|nr:hypothetical protein [Puia sp.]
MLLQRDPRFETIKPMMKEGKIKVFADIFRYVKVTMVARSLGKRTQRFKELVETLHDFYIRELVMIAHLFGLTIDETLRLVAKQLGDIHIVEEEVRFPSIVPLVNDGKIRILSDILRYSEIAKLAEPLGGNRSRAKKSIENVEDMQVKRLLNVARFCGLSATQIFTLVAAQIEEKNHHVKTRSRP